MGVGIMGIVDDCKHFHDEKSDSPGLKCVMGVISTVIGIGTAVSELFTFIGSVRETGLIYTNPVVKRQVEDALSGHFGTEIRHIADWDGTMSDDVTKRENSEPIPVFGIHLQGRDMHFAVVSSDQNSTQLRIGHGPGPDTESNRRRLRSRKVQFNGAIFKKGGMDFEVVADPNHKNDNKYQFNPSSQIDFDWIYKQVECYMSLDAVGPILVSNPVDIMGRLNKVGGIYFQVNNRKQNMIMGSGKMAPFLEGKKSMISKMKKMRRLLRINLAGGNEATNAKLSKGQGCGE